MRGKKAKAIRRMLRAYEREEAEKYRLVPVSTRWGGMTTVIQCAPGSYRWKYRFLKKALKADA